MGFLSCQLDNFPAMEQKHADYSISNVLFPLEFTTLTNVSTIMDIKS